MTGRPEDRNATMRSQSWPDGATLAELRQFVAVLDTRLAPDDAHPEVTVNERHEVVFMTCVVERREQ